MQLQQMRREKYNKCNNIQQMDILNSKEQWSFTLPWVVESHLLHSNKRWNIVLL